MNSTTLNELRDAMMDAKENWLIHFMDFVDEFRRTDGEALKSEPLQPKNERYDALLASTVECLCHEIRIDPPEWIWDVPSCKEPWFLSGMENLKAIAIAESPVYFRRRKIFVLNNFLSRV